MIFKIFIDTNKNTARSDDVEITINSVQTEQNEIILEVSKPDPELESYTWQQ
jgi:hypothetical protein